MIWLLPAAACSITIALILKVNETRRGDRVLLAAANYIVAAVLSLVLLGTGLLSEGSASADVARDIASGPAIAGGWAAAPAAAGFNVFSSAPDATTLILGVIAGVDYVLGFLLLMAGIARGPLAVPVTVMRLSVAVPIAASIILWSEHPGGFQWAGIALGMIAILLFGWGLSKPGAAAGRGGGYWFFILGLFFVMGLGDLFLKAFRELAPGVENLLFTGLLFSVAAVFTWILVAVRRVPLARGTFVLGLVLGLPNLFSTVFTLMALRTVPASIAFPFVNLTVILGSALLGLLLWRERLRGLALAGLAAAAGALVMLPIR